ncbi:hypothetical protein [Pilimelia columellifera]|uniref:hypothetical protein n=1 Tax=Pilimelia columellifera TaxID=706574 RepID=UPI0031DBDFD4
MSKNAMQTSTSPARRWLDNRGIQLKVALVAGAALAGTALIGGTSLLGMSELVRRGRTRSVRPCRTSSV